MPVVKIILTALFTAIAYGIIHDTVTAHLCVEYFTVGHPKIIESESPVALALLWGLIATWWVGLPMGLLLAGFNQLGAKPSLDYKEVRKLIFKLVLFMFALALMAGIIGFTLSELEVIYLVPRLAEQIDPSKYSKFLAAGWAHTVSYLSGIVGTIVVCRIIWKRRKLAEVRTES